MSNNAYISLKVTWWCGTTQVHGLVASKTYPNMIKIEKESILEYDVNIWINKWEKAKIVMFDYSCDPKFILYKFLMNCWPAVQINLLYTKKNGRAQANECIDDGRGR